MRIWIVVSCVVAGLGPAASTAQNKAATASLPYVAVHDPQFISVREATFMSADNRVIGLMDGATAKAYPAGILSQHGLVQDTSRSGPIAITW